MGCTGGSDSEGRDKQRRTCLQFVVDLSNLVVGGGLAICGTQGIQGANVLSFYFLIENVL